MTATATTYEALGGHGDTHRALGTRGYSEHPAVLPLGPWGPAGYVVARVRDGLGDLGVSTDPCAPQTVVGDSEYHHFHYRIPPERVRVVEVGGDLQLESVKIF